MDEINNELGKASTLAGINREIAAARKTLKALQAETAEAEKAVATLNKQRTDAERRLVALNLEANRLLGIRAEAEAVYADIKAKVYSVEWGSQP